MKGCGDKGGEALEGLEPSRPKAFPVSSSADIRRRLKPGPDGPIPAGDYLAQSGVVSIRSIH
jgi:hypothetical protein